ncbi:armadillo repeat-containing protein 12 isoform X2 [Numida meleagris]|uniref:armadillo repeat-containing protein 12 isoform X2 n=1 Tax=Numida meleagris TaxID=8996 RepID=UPI000B3DA5F1|nr:armadillo repeat-containing protein 12 isoform X2 [Numida meleagris]
MAACWGTWTGRDVLSMAMGAGAIYLLYKTISAGLNSPPSTTGAHDSEGLSMEEMRSNQLHGELERMLALLGEQEGPSRASVLNSIARCVLLLEPEPCPCSPEDLQLLLSCVDDPSKDTQIQALNALRAFATQHELKPQIQVALSTCDVPTRVAGLRLLNVLEVPPEAEPLLCQELPTLLHFLQQEDDGTQLQVLRLLTALSRREDFLHHILSCQVPENFLTTLQTSLSGPVLYELLLLLEVLHEGCTQPRRTAVHNSTDTCSLHEALFGDSSRLAELLLATFVHPEEEVQLQACRVILSLQFCTPGRNLAATTTTTTLSDHSFTTTFEFPTYLSGEHSS